MKLHVGERLHGTGPPQQPGGYLVTDVVRETPWYGLYTGKKILYNFDFTAKRVRETDDKEWLDVYLRTLHYPRLDDPADVGQRRRLARSEVGLLGNRGSNLWPEPIDLLEIENTRDVFTFPPAEDDREPIVVFARPDGQPLGDWQQSAVPVSSLLSVLAELLEFVRQAHAEGLILQGLGPAAILIDRADRVHYIGSDMVAELKELPQVRRLFSPERYPRGFAAPEFFDPNQIPSPRSDLYAWGTLAYFLFTGHMPWQIALEQNRPWAHFDDSHFERLDKALRQIPPAHVAIWAEQLGLEGAALLQDWPRNLVALFRWLVHPDPARRPGSADEVRAWMIALPPAQIKAVVALDAGGGQTHLYLDFETLEPGAEIEVRRALDEAPTQPQQGALAYAGPPQVVVVDSEAPLTEEPYYYTIFSRKRGNAGVVYSSGVACQAIQPSADDLLPLAEAEAAAFPQGDRLPPRLALCFRAMEPVSLAETLLRARRPVVRGWALQRLAEALAQTSSPQAEHVVRRMLRDPDLELRLRAARTLWLLSDRSDAALLRLLQEMGQGQLDDAIAAAHALQGKEIPADQLARVIEQLEGERPTTCPLCGAPLPRRDRIDHMRTVHNYVEVDGAMLPRRRAEARLWERVFSAGDMQAHRHLLELFDGMDGQADGYVRALEQQIQERSQLDEPESGVGPSPEAWKRWEPWLACVRQAMGTHPVLVRLLRSESDRVREAGRALVLPRLGERLRGASVEVAEVRRVLEEMLPGAEWLNERIRLCRRLPQVGVEATKAQACAALLQEELPAPCPECAAQVRSGDLELHLRRLHGIFQFRGVRRSYTETRDFLLATVCGARPDVQAWQTLVSLAEDRHGAAASERLPLWLCHTIKAVAREERTRVVTVAADAIARTEEALRLLPVLLGDNIPPAWKNVARQLALEIVARREQAPPPDIVAMVKPYLAAKEVPPESRRRGMAGLMKAAGMTDVQALELLQTYVSATSRHRAVDRLHELEQETGQSPLLDSFIAGLEERIRMTCPRCQVELERRDMVGHLWDKHRLVLEGRRVREPWRVLADWVVDYGLEKDPVLLERCRELAERTDPQDGLYTLQRLLVRQGVEDRDAWAALLSRARQRGVSLCPHCYGHLPVPATLPPLHLAGTDHLEGYGFLVEIDESGLRPQVRITTPAGLLYEDPEPGAWLTRLGGVVALAGPVFLAAFGLIYGVLGSALPGILLLLLAVGLGLFLGGLVYFFWPQRRRRPRLLDAAWHILIPEILGQPLSQAGADFVGSLAATSVGHFLADPEVLEETIVAMQRHASDSAALLPLWRLQELDAERRREDPVPLVVERLGQALAGEFPLRLITPLIGDLRDRWPKGRLIRLQALVIERAAAIGVDAADLAEVGRLQPALGQLLGSGDHDHLSQWQCLCYLRSRPTAWLAQADHIFDLARDPTAEKLLADRPDLLLLPRSAPMYVGTRGVWLKDVCITQMPERVDVVTTRSQEGEGFEVVVGVQRVWFTANPNKIADELERWLRFYFGEFLPQVPQQALRRNAEASRRLWRANALPCPECRRPAVPIVGEVGVRIVETEAQLAS